MTDLNLSTEIKQDKKIRFSPYLLLAFAVPALLFLIIYLLRDVYPLGEESVLVLDLNAQYVYFFEELRDILHGDGSLLYSWQRAMGGEFMGMFAYYVASPFNLLIAFFPEKSITEALLTIFILKAGLSGFNFAVYLHYSGRAKNKFATVIFSTIYALTAYAVVNGHNTMWIDALLFLPILILGLESLINKKKYILYTIILAITVMSNFYIGYMVCIFIVLYSFFYYFAYGYSDEYNETGESYHFIKSFLRILLFSLIAIAMAAVIIFTVYYSLKFGKNDFSDPKYDLNTKFNFFELFAKMLPNSYDTVRPSGLPFIYCGVLTLILLPIYFITKKISPREKIWSALILSALLFSFSGSTIDIFWHGLQNPNWLNYRYSFMLCFLMVTFAHKAFCFIKEIKFNHVVAVCLALIFIIVSVQNQEYEYIDGILCIWLSLILAGVYLITLYFHHKEKGENFTALILAIIVSTELLINGYLNLDSLDRDVVFSSRTSYREFIDELDPLVDYIHNKDDSFYRMEKTSHRKTNDNMTLDINGLSSSTSTLNASVIKLLNQLGYSSKSHWSKYLGGTPVSDSLLGIKYIIDTDQNSELYEQIHKTDDHRIYKNPYAMSIAFAVSTQMEEVDFNFFSTPFELLNATVTAMLGEKETVMLFKPIENVTESLQNTRSEYATHEYLKYTPINTSIDASISYMFTAGTTDEIFFFYPSDYPRKVDLSLNNRDWGTFFDNETDRIISLGSFDEDETVKLRATLQDENLYILRDQKYFWSLDTEVFKDVFARLDENSFAIDEYTATYFKGKITVDEKEELLFTSIPYDEGWHIICDGEELPLTMTANSLLAAEIPQGEHVLELKYLPDCFVQGSVISCMGIILFAVIVILDLSIKKSRKKKALKVKESIDEFYQNFDFSEVEEVSDKQEKTENTEETE